MSLDLTSVIGTSETDLGLGNAVRDIAAGVRAGHRMLVAFMGTGSKDLCQRLREAGIDAAIGTDQGVRVRVRDGRLRSVNAARLDALLSRFTAVIVPAPDAVDERGAGAILETENPAAYAVDLADRLALRVYRRVLDQDDGLRGPLGSLLGPAGLERTLSLGRVTRIQALVSPAARDYVSRLGGRGGSSNSDGGGAGELAGDVAAWRLAEMAETAFGEPVCWAKIARRGVDSLSEAEVLSAASHGRVFELVATAERIDHMGGAPTLAMRVGPVPLRAFDEIVPAEFGWGSLLVEFEGGRRVLVRGRLEDRATAVCDSRREPAEAVPA